MISNHHSLRRRLFDAVQEQSLAMSKPHSHRILLATPPFQLPEGVALTYHRGAPLSLRAAKNTFPAHGVLHYWPEYKVHSARFPYFGFVLEGNIDWRIGITARAARQYKGELLHHDYALLRLPAGTAFLMPTETPYASGELPHWYDQNGQPAHYKILWIRFLPSGVECHFSWTAEGKPVSETDYFVSDPHLFPIAMALIDELQQRGQADTTASKALLQAAFHRLAYDLRELQEKRPGFIRKAHEEQQSSDATVELACRYIEAHSHEKLTLDDIARHSFVSSGHLCRVFREQKRVTINQYITQHRLERACALLRGSSLSMSAVGKSVGYPDSAYFSRLFSRHYGRPPLEFRQRHLEEYYKKSNDVRKSQK